MIGDVLWRPPADLHERSEIGRYLSWLREHRALAFEDYEALWRWSVNDLDGFWSSIWDFYGIRAHTRYDRVLGSRTMPGAEWFPAPGSTTASTCSALRPTGTGLPWPARSQTRPPLELTFGELRDAVARAGPACSGSGSNPATAWWPICRTSPRRSSPSSPPPVSARSGPPAHRSSEPAA